MAANLTDHMPINLARTVSGLGWQIMGYKEKAYTNVSTRYSGNDAQLE
jgi:hypothetical protein